MKKLVGKGFMIMILYWSPKNSNSGTFTYPLKDAGQNGVFEFVYENGSTN